MAAEKGNRYAQKHSLEEWEQKFEQVYEGAKEGKYLSLQQAWIENDIRPSTAKWLIKNYQVLANIKKDINDSIISVINKGSLLEGMQATAAIWRMKQLGETDRTEVTNLNHEMQPLTSEEINQAKDKLKDKLDDY